MNVLKNKIYILFSLIFLTFSAGAFAQSAAPIGLGSKDFVIKEELYEVKNIDDIGQDLGKRFILATLGKDALIYFLPNGSDLQSQIVSLSDADLEKYSRPFNSQMISGTLVMVSTAFLVAFVTIILYIIWIYVETIMRTQESGSFIGDDWSKYFTPVKIVIGFTLVYPMMGKNHEPFKSLNSLDGASNVGAFSMAQYIVLKIAGMSNDAGNRIYGEYIRTTPIYYPAVKFPNQASKSRYTQDLLDFVSCAKMSLNKDVVATFVRKEDNDGVFKLDISAGVCNLKSEIGFDIDTISKLKESKSLSSIYSAEAYESKQKQIIKKTLEKVFTKASLISDKLIIAADKSSYDINALPNTYDHDNWADGCDNIENHIERRLSKKDRVLMYSSSAKCLSKILVEDLASPTKPFKYIYGDDNHLENGYLELCSHTPNQNSTKTRTAIKYLNFDPSLSPKNKDLNSCISETCNGGNLIECSAAIGVASQLSDREKMARQGWVTAGANSYTLFKTINGGYGRGIINRINFVNDPLMFKVPFTDTNKNKEIESFTLNIDLKAPEGIKADYTIYNGIVDANVRFYEEVVSDLKPLPMNPDGWFGTKKFQYCVEHPMQVSGGFVCGNITEEMHQLGSKLIALGIQLKSISMLATSYAAVKKPADPKTGTISGKGSKKTGKVGGLMAKASGLVDKAAAKKGITAAFKLLDFAIPTALVGWFLYETGIGNDAFTDFNDEVFKQYPELLSLVAGAAVAGVSVSDVRFIGSVLNLAVYTLIPLGILFAFILPLIPLVFSMIVVAGFVTQLMIGLLLSNIWGVVLMTPSRDHSSSASVESTKIVVSMLLKAPLSVAGLIVAWNLNNLLISEIMIFADIGDSLALKNNDVLRSFIDQFVILIVYFLMVYGLYNIIFSLIEGFHEIAVDTLFSGRSVSPFANNQRGDNWKKAMDQTKNIQGGK